MLQWAAFYKILDISDSVEDPTAYELFGLEPDTPYSLKQVDQALQETKKKLRHHLPSPQFIPILAAFEVELNKAAKLLSNPSDRKSYDKRLERTVARSDKEKRAKEKRQQLVRAVRKAVNAALNEDGTLDNNKRQLLTTKLANIGLSLLIIESLLKRIPTPTKASPLMEALSAEAEALPRATNAPSHITHRPARIGWPKQEFIYRVGLPLLSVTIFVASILFFGFNYARNTELAGRQNPLPASLSDHTRPQDSDRSTVQAPLLSGKTLKQEKVEAIPAPRPYDRHADEVAARAMINKLDAPEQPGSYGQSLQSLAISLKQEPLVIPADTDPNRSAQTFEKDEKSMFSSTAQSQASLGPVAQRVIQGMTKPPANIRFFLADAAIAGIGCAQQFIKSPWPRSMELNVLLNLNNRVPILTQNALIVPMPTSLPMAAEVNQDLSPIERQTFAATLKSSETPQLYHVIATLGQRARAESGGAIELLFDEANRRAENARDKTDFQPLWRIVRELQQVNDPSVPGHLAKLLRRSNRSAFAHRLTYLLRETINPDLQAPSPGLLPFENSRPDRIKAAQFWQKFVHDENFRWNSLAVKYPGEIESPGWTPDWDAIRLLGSLEYHLNLIVRNLGTEEDLTEVGGGQKSHFRSLEKLTRRQKELLTLLKDRVEEEQAELKRRPHAGMAPIIPSRILRRLQQTLNDLVWELNHRLLDRTDTEDHTASINAIGFERRSRKVGDTTEFQKIAIDLDIISMLLELIVLDSLDESKIRPILEIVGADRKAAMGKTPDVIMEIRDNLFRNLALWELAAPVLQASEK